MLLNKVSLNVLLKNKLTLGMIIVFSLALVSMFYFINVKVTEIIHDHVVTVAFKDAQLHTSKIDSWFNAATQRVDDMTRFLKILPDADFFPEVAQSFVEKSAIDNTFIGIIDGSMINGTGFIPPEGWQIKDAPWYKPARMAGGDRIVITDPYRSLSTGKLATSIALYVPELNGTSGIVAIQIAIDFISDLIAYYSTIGEGYLILVGNDNYVIVHPQGFAPDKEGEFYHLCEIPGGEFYIELISGEEDVMKFDESSIGQSYVIRSNLESVDWTLLSVIPMENIQELVTDYTSSIMSVIALVLFVMFIIIALFMAKLNTVSAKAQKANQAKTTFFSNMNHEIRTPMNAILGMAAIGKKSKDSTVKNHSFDRIEEASTHLLGLINDVLDMSKIEAGKFELYNDEFEFENMVRKVVNIMESGVTQKSLKLSVSIDAKIPKYIIADEQKLMQIITNLLSNAVKFTPNDGAIRLIAYLIGEQDGLYTIKVEVEDTGTGVSPELLPKLFDSYEQADNETTRKVGGTGLGLAIAKRIVELFQGEIWAESEMGKGSTFSFTIKVSGIKEIKPIQNLELEPISQGNDDVKSFQDFKILLVEDIEINREIFIALVEEFAMDITYAVDGTEAVAKFNKSPNEYDLIFMDLNMPNMDGITATRQIRKLGMGHSKTVPIIAMTADIFQTTIDECFAAGMNDYISKPLNSTVIADKLNKYLK